jgi:nucleoside-diphosphate-sugar epimerase
LVAGVKDADATIHLAYVNDFSKLQEAGQVELAAVKAMLGASHGKAFVSTTTLLGVQITGDLGTENDPALTAGPGGPRGQSEVIVREAAQSGVKSAVIRLPPTVHYVHDTGFIPSLVRLARKTGVSAYPNNGDSRWAAVHRDDLARLYRIVVEKLTDGTLTPGLALHGVTESGVTTKDIASAIADKLQLGAPVSKPAEHFELLGGFLSMSFAVSNDITRKLTGWQPTGPTLSETIHDPDFSTESTKTTMFM